MGVFKSLDRAKDIAASKTLLHEAIPLTGSILSGTYSDNNVKNYAHGMFQSVFDYPYLSSSANHIFDITCAYSADSALSKSTTGAGAYGTTADATQEKKINLYNSMAKILVGHDHTGSIKQFDQDGDFITTTTDKFKEVFFLCFSVSVLLITLIK